RLHPERTLVAGSAAQGVVVIGALGYPHQEDPEPEAGEVVLLLDAEPEALGEVAAGGVGCARPEHDADEVGGMRTLDCRQAALAVAAGLSGQALAEAVEYGSGRQPRPGGSCSATACGDPDRAAACRACTAAHPDRRCAIRTGAYRLCHGGLGRESSEQCR